MVCKGFQECHSSRVKVKGCNDCLIITNESKPTVEENNISFTIYNKSRQTSLKFRVDNGIICGVDEVRCDYLIMFPDCVKAFYIELKGQGWRKALQQLHNTYKLLHPEMIKYIPHLRAVVNNDVPNTRYIQEMKVLKDIRRSYPLATLEVSSKFKDEV